MLQTLAFDRVHSTPLADLVNLEIAGYWWKMYT